MIYIIEGMSGAGKTSAINQLKEKYPNAKYFAEYLNADEAITCLTAQLISDDMIFFDRICLMRMFNSRENLNDINKLNEFILKHTDKIKFLICMTRNKFLFDENFKYKHSVYPDPELFDYFLQFDNIMTGALHMDIDTETRTILEILELE